LNKPEMSPADIRLVQTILRDVLSDLGIAKGVSFDFDSVCEYLAKQKEAYQETQTIRDTLKEYQDKMSQAWNNNCYVIINEK
jgi:cell shape-determining protein MreC